MRRLAVLLSCWLLLSNVLPISGQADNVTSVSAADDAPSAADTNRPAGAGATTGKVFVYKRSQGEPQEIEVFFPPNHDPQTAQVPGIILFHGGNWTGGTRGQFRRACQYFASRGLVAATADYRKLTAAERTKLAPGESRKRLCVTDAKSAIRWFKQHAQELGIDANRVITGGGSAGGHISVLATLTPELNDPADPADIDTSVVAYVLFNPAFALDDTDDRQIDVQAQVVQPIAPAVAFFGTKDRWLEGWQNLQSKLTSLGDRSTTTWIAADQPHGFFNRDPWQTLTLLEADRFLVQHKLLSGEPTLSPPASKATLQPAVTETTAKVGHWNLDELFQTPKMRWLDQTGPVHSLVYQGEPFNGQETEVFAFYASPATLGEAPEGTKFPGVVLIHGGGGTAFADWTWLWAKRGYAAIAMDLSGSRPMAPIFDEQGAPVPGQAARSNTRTRLPNGGPNHGHQEKFGSIGGDHSDDWPYHAAASVIRAHSLLRSFPEVISDRTAITGISWGGYTTCLVASLDHRFKAAVPVYGCGFLHEGESVQKPEIDNLGDRRDAWVAAYDPSSLLPRCQVPTLFVNGTNDVHYPLDSYQKSFDVTGGQKQIRIEVNMPHGHLQGWAPAEIGLFIDSHCRDGVALPVPGKLRTTDGTVELEYASNVPLQSAALHYTTGEGLRSKRQWTTVASAISANKVTTPAPPADANTWFITLTDERGAMVSTPVQFAK